MKKSYILAVICALGLVFGSANVQATATPAAGDQAHAGKHMGKKHKHKNKHKHKKHKHGKHKKHGRVAKPTM